jgi:hypothetical protein
MSLDGKNRRCLTTAFDREVAHPHFAHNGQGIYFQYEDEGDTKVGYVSLATGKVEEVAAGVGGVNFGRPYASGSYSVAHDGRIAFTQTDPTRPADVATVAATGSEPQRLTQLNEDLLPYRRLAEAELAPIVDEAIARWDASGLVPHDFDWSKLRFAITDLGPAYLGLGNPDGAILLDDDGAGWGWFVDSSPTTDDEFTNSVSHDAVAHMDLLTVVMHEIGHALGYPTGSAQDTPAAALMSERLAVGVRRTPGSAATADGSGTTDTEAVVVPSDLLASSGFDSSFFPTLSSRSSGGTAPSSQDYAIYALSSFTDANRAIVEQADDSAKLRVNKTRRTSVM